MLVHQVLHGKKITLCLPCVLIVNFCLRNVVGLAIGYSKVIVLDMGLCLQVYYWHRIPNLFEIIFFF
jgi:hypothetical protein